MSYRWWILVSLLIFVAAVVLGTLTPASESGTFGDYLAGLQEFSRLVKPFSLATAVIIFFKNALSLLLSFIFSPVLCLMPVFSLVVNGWLMGFISAVTVQHKSLVFLLAGIMPHGILEIPAFVMGNAIAISFGVLVMLAIFKKERRALLLPRLRRSLRYLAMIVIALLLPAAFIETYVTPLLLGLLS